MIIKTFFLVTPVTMKFDTHACFTCHVYIWHSGKHHIYSGCSSILCYGKPLCSSVISSPSYEVFTRISLPFSEFCPIMSIKLGFIDNIINGPSTSMVPKSERDLMDFGELDISMNSQGFPALHTALPREISNKKPEKLEPEHGTTTLGMFIV